MHAFNTSTGEVKSGGSLISIEPSLIYIKSFGQPGRHNKETLSRTKQNPKPVGRGREQAYVLPELSQKISKWPGQVPFPVSACSAGPKPGDFTLALGFISPHWTTAASPTPRGSGASGCRLGSRPPTQMWGLEADPRNPGPLRATPL